MWPKTFGIVAFKLVLKVVRYLLQFPCRTFLKQVPLPENRQLPCGPIGGCGLDYKALYFLGAENAVASAFVEGASINTTCRMTGVAKHTVLKLLKDMGCACAAYHNAHVREPRVRRVQTDEIWSFVYGKDKDLTSAQVKSGLGNVWTWKAIDADTKLVISCALGDRGADT